MAVVWRFESLQSGAGEDKKAQLEARFDGIFTTQICKYFSSTHLQQQGNIAAGYGKT